MNTFVFIDSANSAVHIVRAKLGSLSIEDKAADICERLNIDLSQCEWIGNKAVDVITHYGIKVHDDASEE